MTESTKPTREERLTQLEEMKAPELNEAMAAANLTTVVGQKNADKIVLILGAEYGPADVPGKPTPTPATPGTSGTSTAPPKVATKKPEEDPLTAQAKELDAKLGKLYDDLVEKIKAAKVEGATADTADQMRAGAVQFFRQCNATLNEARLLLESCKDVNEKNSAQLQAILKATKNLNERSEVYNRMAKPKPPTTPTAQ